MLVLKTDELSVSGFVVSLSVRESFALVTRAFATARKRTKRGLVDVSHLEKSGVRWVGRLR